MHFRTIFYVLGNLLILVGVTMVAPLAVALAMDSNLALERYEVLGFFVAITGALLAGMTLRTVFETDLSHLGNREGSAIVALTWLVASLVGCLPWVITGAASGMGQAAAQLLVDLGAEVYALDIAPVSVPVAQSIKVDMKDHASIDAAVEALPTEIYALFNCAGVPCPPFSAEDTVLINFVGLRHLTESLIPRIAEGGGIASIASTAGMAWRPKVEIVKDFLALDSSQESAKKWMAENPEAWADGYGFSKQCIIIYTMHKAKELAERNIRINCISPSPTDSGFMEKLKGEGQMPAEAVDLFLPSNGRYATGAEMGEPLVLLNSKLASFVSGNNLPVDFGYCAEIFTGQRDDLLGIGS